LASFANGGCVHDREELLKIVEEHLVKELLMSEADALKHEIAIEWAVEVADLAHDALDHTGGNLDLRRKKAAEAKAIAVLLREASGEVGVGVLQKLGAVERAV
jgi:hypothetical protein